MTLIRTVEPAVEPVTLAEAKAHLRLADTSEDDLISGLIRAARQDVERATCMALIDQHWRLVLDCWPASGLLKLPLHPVREILSITVYGSDGEASLIDHAAYEADLISRPARLYLAKRPEPLRMLNGIEVDFRAGFSEAGTDVPDLLKRAILLLAAHWYEFRAGFGPSDQPVAYPAGYERMIAGYRAGRL
ncbi:head-tail connector protein [Manganibacter manganicus]|uniref:Phage gp6-like head-tail connector protein n=1 Tax=Manganibacter manganicus TaxID=1873176 RepID=A0A1V8RPT6_9HYPH|nr:head-tail connector protein [Pseudaminobacter manganicus]OQM75212.1 hypothetical protein BFN67_19600 [Pseudaminobacter manganicus]